VGKQHRGFSNGWQEHTKFFRPSPFGYKRMSAGGKIETISLLGGTGHLGVGLALRWAPKHRVLIGSREKERALAARDRVLSVLNKRGFKATVDGNVNEEIVTGSDLVVFCVPYEPALEIAHKIRDSLTDQIVLSPVAPMEKRDDFLVPSLTPPDCAAVRVREILPKNVSVVSTLHNVPADKLYVDGPMPDYAIVVYGENPAKRTVMNLVREMKLLVPLDGGPLEFSYLSEQITPLLLNLARLNKKKDLSTKFF